LTHAQPIHPDADVGLVKLKVSELARSIDFYREVVGLTLLSRSETEAELGAVEGGAPLLALEELAKAVMPRRRTAGLYHFAILVPDRRALGLALKRLIRAGIRIGQADHLVSEALYIDDPDGNGIEIYRDRPRSEWPRDSDGGIRMATDPIDWEGLLAEAGGDESDALPAGTKMGHVHLHVSSLEEAHRFYCEGLGFELVLNFGGSALFVSAGGYHHHLGLNTWAGVGAPPTPANAPGLSYYTLAFPDAAAREDAAAGLRAVGASVQTERDAWFATDPSGNRIRLVVA